METLFCAIEWNDVDEIIRSVESGAKLNAPYRGTMSRYRGLTPLEIAVLHSKPEVISVLIRLGADIDRANRSGETPLMMAMRMGYSGIAAFLLELGANTEFENRKGETPLLYALFYDNALLVRLLRAGSDVNHPRPDGMTLLDYAYQGRLDEATVLLLREGARIESARSASGKQAADFRDWCLREAPTATAAIPPIEGVRKE